MIVYLKKEFDFKFKIISHYCLNSTVLNYFLNPNSYFLIKLSLLTEKKDK